MRSPQTRRLLNAVLVVGVLDQLEPTATVSFGEGQGDLAPAAAFKKLFDGAQPLAESVEQIVVRTRQFAVRQLRWFQRDPRIRWVDIAHDPLAEAGPIVAAALDT